MPLNLEPVQSGYNLSVINENFQRIEDTWDEKLDRLVSSQANYMEQELDMNSNHIINHPAPRNELDLVRLKELEQLVLDTDAIGVVPQVQPRQLGDGVTTEFSAPHDRDSSPNAFFVNIDGVTQRPFTDYGVPSAGIITFAEAPPFNAVIDITWFEPNVVEADYERPYIFDTVADMRANALGIPAGSKLSTKGYYVAGDGGSADYLVEALDNPDEYGTISLGGGLMATAQGKLTAKQYGARGIIGDDTDDYAPLLAYRAWALISNERVMTLDAGAEFYITQSPFNSNTSKTMRVEGAGINSTTIIAEGDFAIFNNEGGAPGVTEQGIEIIGLRVFHRSQTPNAHIVDLRDAANQILIRDSRFSGGNRALRFRDCYRAHLENLFISDCILGLDTDNDIDPDDVTFMFKFLNVTWFNCDNCVDVDFTRFTNTAVIEFDTCNFESSNALAIELLGANVNFSNCYIENNYNPFSSPLFLSAVDSVVTFDSNCLIHYSDIDFGTGKCIMETDRVNSLLFGQGIQWRINISSGLDSIVKGPKGAYVRQIQGRQGTTDFQNYGQTVSGGEGAEYVIRDEEFSQFNTQATMGRKNNIVANGTTQLLFLSLGQGVFSGKLRATLVDEGNATTLLETDILIYGTGSTLQDVRITPSADQFKLGWNEGVSRPEIDYSQGLNDITFFIRNSNTAFDYCIWELSEITSSRGENVASINKL